MLLEELEAKALGRHKESSVIFEDEAVVDLEATQMIDLRSSARKRRVGEEFELLRSRSCVTDVVDEARGENGCADGVETHGRS